MIKNALQGMELWEGASFSNCLVLIKCGLRIWWPLSLWQCGRLPSGEMNRAIRL